MAKIATLAPDTGPRYIDPNTPVAKQIAVLDQLRKNPPENSRRVTITPDLAEHILLNLHDVNRSRRSKSVRDYAEDMASGRWRLTGDTIKFGKSGMLRDGQHRLAACVRAGVPFETYVIFGLDDDAFAVMDIGAKRTGNDTFKLAEVPNANTAAAAVRWDKILTGPKPDDRSQGFSNRELLEHYRRLATRVFDDCVSAAKNACKGQKEVPESVLAALAYIYRHKHASAVDRFMADLVAGKRGAGVLVNLLAKIRKQNLGRMHETQRNAMMIKALNCYVKGTRINEASLKWNDTMPFPSFA